jgi:hypothetical protein
MIFSLLSIPVFATAYLFKGGQFNNYLDKLPNAFGGKFFAALIIFVFCATLTSDWVHGLIFCVAWLLAVSPSMGEEAGAVGRWGFSWGEYIDKGFGRMYGVQKALQRGAWMGAVFTVAGAATISIPIMAIGFPLAHLIGQEIHWRVHKKDDWKYSEVIVGALLGFCYLLDGLR